MAAIENSDTGVFLDTLFLICKHYLQTFKKWKISHKNSHGSHGMAATGWSQSATPHYGAHVLRVTSAHTFHNSLTPELLPSLTFLPAPRDIRSGES